MENAPVKVRDIIAVMESLAPSELAESWDNPGLQVGDADWKVKKIRVALDPLPEVVKQACRDKIDLLITHHPLIFRPLKSVDISSSVGQIIHLALESRLAVFSAHTNLDSAQGGLNDYLSEILGLYRTRVLQKTAIKGRYKLVVFVPEKFEREVLTSLFSSGAGKIEAYSCCSFRSQGKGTFMPGKGSEPFLGKIGQVNEVDESRIEMIVSQKDLPATIEQLNKVHPYETPAYDIYPLEPIRSAGLGRVGDLETPLCLKDFAAHVKKVLRLSSLKISGDPDLIVRQVAVCSGSGAGLMQVFLNSGAQCYVSGDLHYHNARDVQIRKRALVDIGHFASEHIVVPMLVDKIRKAADKKQMEIRIDGCETEKDPFETI